MIVYVCSAGACGEVSSLKLMCQCVAAWELGYNEMRKDGHKSAHVPRVCFVPNNPSGERSTHSEVHAYSSFRITPCHTCPQVLMWVFPIVWLYFPLALSAILTLTLSRMSYMRLLRGTTASILSRFRIVLVSRKGVSACLETYVMLIGMCAWTGEFPKYFSECDVLGVPRHCRHSRPQHPVPVPPQDVSGCGEGINGDASRWGV